MSGAVPSGFVRWRCDLLGLVSIRCLIWYRDLSGTLLHQIQWPPLQLNERQTFHLFRDAGIATWESLVLDNDTTDRH